MFFPIPEQLQHKIKFLIAFDDQHVSIPSEIEILDTVIDIIPAEEITFKFKFKKTELISQDEHDNIILYYSVDNFTDHLDSLNFLDFKSFIFNNKDYCKVIIIDSEIFLSNNFITITNNSEYNFHESKPNYKRETLHNTDNNSDNESIEITPDQIFFRSVEKSNIVDIFNKWCGYLCLKHLSSNVDKTKGEDSYVFHFNGQKKVSLQTTIDKNKMDDVNNLFYFYEWVYTEKTEDKIGIFHNLLPLHINLKKPIDIQDFLSALPELEEATKENFNFYIQENIKTYLDERKKIEDIVMNTSKLISTEISRITDLVIRTLTGIFLSIISAIIAVSIRSQFHYIVSYGLYIFGIIIIISFIFITYFSWFSVKISYKYFKDSISEYTNLLNPNRIKGAERPIIERRQLFIRMIIFTGILLSILVIFIFSLAMYFHNGSNLLIDNLIKMINNLISM